MQLIDLWLSKTTEPDAQVVLEIAGPFPLPGEMHVGIVGRNYDPNRAKSWKGVVLESDQTGWDTALLDNKLAVVFDSKTGKQHHKGTERPNGGLVPFGKTRASCEHRRASNSGLLSFYRVPRYHDTSRVVDSDRPRLFRVPPRDHGSGRFSFSFDMHNLKMTCSVLGDKADSEPLATCEVDELPSEVAVAVAFGPTAIGKLLACSIIQPGQLLGDAEGGTASSALNDWTGDASRVTLDAARSEVSEEVKMARQLEM